MIAENNKKDNLINDTLEIRKAKRLQTETYRNVLDTSEIELSKNMISLIKNCGTFLEFLGTNNLEHLKLVGANFCKHRFCPHCSYNKARRDSMELMILTKYLQEKGYKFLFLTLTAPNVSGEDLEKELRSYFSSFERLMKLKEVKNVVKGYVRKIEITYNSERGDYHPHYHVLIAVKEYYFTNSNYYISQAKWLEYWKQAKRDETITQVDVRRFNIDKDPTAIFEMSKYIAKDSNYLHSEEVFEVFYKALKGKREFSFSGEFKKARTLYKNGDLDYLKEKDTNIYLYKIWSLWKSGKYEIKDLILLTPEEVERYKINMIDEMDIE